MNKLIFSIIALLFIPGCSSCCGGIETIQKTIVPAHPFQATDVKKINQIGV